MIKKSASRITLAVLAGIAVSSAQAQDIDPVIASQPTQTDTGGAGLLQMPSARMAPEGEFSLLYYDNEEYRRIAVSMQVFPWLETTLRYNDIRTRLYSSSPGFSGDQTYKDRGVDIKARLWKESLWLPELSVGLRDLAGTGKFASEYIVASKRFGPLDLTLGLGFGYMGRADDLDNPFCELSTEFCRRGGAVSGQGGKFEVDSWFSGESALFAGIEYQTPWRPLSIKVEYEGNDYSDEPSLTNVEQDSRWNFGLHYRVSDNANLQVSYERGNTLMFGFNFRTNFNSANTFKKTPPLLSPTNPATDELAQVDFNELATKIYRNSGFGVKQINASDDGRTVSVVGYQGTYSKHSMSIDRASAVLARELPPSVQEYRFIDSAWDYELAQVTVNAAKYKRAYYRADFTSRYEDAYKLVSPEAQTGTLVFNHERDVSWPDISFRPYLEQSYGNPENFYMYQLRLDAYGDWAPTDNFVINGVLSGNLFTNYDEFNFLVDNYDSDVPRVRTYVREYVTQSDIWVNNLQGTYFAQPSSSLFTSYYGGYLERMFGGVGTEWLYREVDSNWALGVDVNYVKQRSFENQLGFRDYDVVTGHVTGYWRPEILDDSLIKVAAGRFLADDKGVQLNFEKKFDSGIIIGAYAAKTNLSAEEYGEGSFTKGFYVSIPFDLFQMTHTAGRARIGWTPLTRDGGQMLGRSNRLYEVSDARSRFYTEW